MNSSFDVIVIGAGHAGLEAACASYRAGAKTALITMNKNNIGEMSCNPAIGGIGKGTIVKEIDALDGIMARAADMASINCKILNKSKGEAVWGQRVQADRKLYKKAVNKILSEDYANLSIIESTVSSISVDEKKSKITGIVLEDGVCLSCSSLVIATGTFLNGLIHVGSKTHSAGRIDERPSISLSKSIRELDFDVGRLKTGTPARLLKKSIDFSGMDEQRSDDAIVPFSFLNDSVSVKQVSCFITHTNKNTHDIILSNASHSPIYSGTIQSKGPRYCPSIEDKITRFSEKERHQIFLEPEGLDSDLIYPNGISTSMPKEVQESFLRTIRGLEKVEIVKYGYAIEYDYVDPREILPTMETKKINGLFLCGQINGTTGYEEAAGQGLVAGVNAALKAKDSARSFILNRTTSYIGVMVDDLTSIGIDGEPYRMFTSRSEYRLLIRGDNADIRLTEIGMDFGIVSQKRAIDFLNKKDKISKINQIFDQKKITPREFMSLGYKISQDGTRRSISDLISGNYINFSDINKIWPDVCIQGLTEQDKTYILASLRYKSYIERQNDEIAQVSKIYSIQIPESIDFRDVKSLSAEVVGKLSKTRPATLGSASLIPGVTPSAISAIAIYLQKNNVIA